MLNQTMKEILFVTCPELKNKNKVAKCPTSFRWQVLL